jgi:predicted ATPase with chaperone activity
MASKMHQPSRAVCTPISATKSAKRRHSLCATSKVEIGPPWAARTLADLDNAQKVGRSQLAEAPSYHALVHHVRFGA